MTTLLPVVCTASVTNGSDVVTVTGTDASTGLTAILSTLNCATNATVFLGGVGYMVKTRLTTTTFQLERNYAGTTATGVACTIGIFTPEMAQRVALSQQLRDYSAQLALLDADGHGLLYNLISPTGAADPGNGNLAFNNATPSAVTEIYVDYNDQHGWPVSSLLGLVSNGTLLIVRSIATTAYVAYKTSGALVDSTGYRTGSALTYIGSGGVLSPGELVALSWGKDGADGAAGANAVWFQSGAPSSGTGANGDLSLDTAGGNFYQKISGSWVLKGNLKGPTGAAGSVIYNGAGAPSSGLGINGDFYINNSNGAYYTKAAGSWGTAAGNLTGPTGATGATGTTGATGATGATGTAGTNGFTPGFRLTFDTTVTDSDPGTGNVRANNATFASITQLFVDNTDVGAASITTWLDSLGAVNNANARAYLRFEKATDPTVWMEFAVTGAVIDGTGYRKIPVSPISGSLPANGTTLAATASKSGQDSLNWRGNYSGATSYQKNDGVLYNSSSFICLTPTTGNAPPTLPTSSNTQWQLLAAKGADGTGTGDASGPGASVDGNFALFNGTTGKLIKDSGVLLDLDGTLAANSDTRLASQKAIKSYVDNAVAGWAWKAPVRVASTANVVVASGLVNGAVVDGATLVTGDRVLLRAQTAAAENGIYVVVASGAASRSTDNNTAAKMLQAAVFVEEGTANADTAWVCTTNAPITLGTTGLTFTQFAPGSQYTADGSTLQLTGLQFSQKDAGTTNAKLANMAANTVKGSVAGGVPVDLTPQQLRAIFENAGPLNGNRNFIINGAMDVWQRGATFTANGYMADRWYGTGASFSVTKQTTGAPLGDTNVLRVSYTAASANCNMFQPLENIEVNKFKGKLVTVGVALRRNGTFAADLNVLLQKNATANTATGGTWSSIAGPTVTNAQLPTATTSTDWYFAKFTATVPNDGTANGLRLMVAESAVGPSGAYWEMGHAFIVLGDATGEADPFSPRNITQETALCQRFFCSYGGNSAFEKPAAGKCNSSTAVLVNFIFATTMRVSPSLAISAAADWAATNSGGGSQVASAITMDQPTPYGACVNLTTTGLTAGDASQLQANNTTSARLTFSAEL